LQDVLSKTEISIFSSQNLNSIIQRKKKEANILEKITQFYLSEVKFESEEDLEVEPITPDDKYVLVYTITRPLNDPDITAMRKYLDEKTVEPSSEAPSPAAAGKSWRSNAQAFQEFWRANRFRKDLSFYMTESRADLQVTEPFVCLYDDGECVSKDYQLIGQCGSVGALAQSHDSLTLTWKKPERGQENITGYRLEYRKVGENTSEHVTIQSPSNEYILRELEPATAYTVQVAALCDIGVGPQGRESVQLSTLPCSPRRKPEAGEEQARPPSPLVSPVAEKTDEKEALSCSLNDKLVDYLQCKYILLN
jgi:hypothetical protein